jgi:hypothetical protein
VGFIADVWNELKYYWCAERVAHIIHVAIILTLGVSLLFALATLAHKIVIRLL